MNCRILRIVARHLSLDNCERFLCNVICICYPERNVLIARFPMLDFFKESIQR